MGGSRRGKFELRGIDPSMCRAGALSVPSITRAALSGLGLWAAALTGCSDTSSHATVASSGSGAVAAPAPSNGTSTESPPPTGAPATGIAAAAGNSEGTPTPTLQGPSNDTAVPGAPSSYVPPPITPPVSDTASPLPVARADGYTTEPNIIYGPLPEHHLDVLYPPSGGPNGTEKLPGVILFHGDGEGENDKAAMASFYSRFLAHGFVVATAEYRGPSQSIAPAAVQDALIATKWFWDHMDYYHVDPTRYVVAGAASGGLLALLVGMVTAEANLGPVNPTHFEIAAIVNAYGPADMTDLLRTGTGFAQAWLPAGTPDQAALARQMSPVTYARGGLPPLLTIQGANDTTVPVAEGLNLDALLKSAGATSQHHLVPGAKHGFETPRTSWPDAEKTIFNFLVARGIGQ